jgi:hypothetical protein
MHDVDERESMAIAQTDQHPAELGGPGGVNHRPMASLHHGPGEAQSSQRVDEGGRCRFVAHFIGDRQGLHGLQDDVLSPEALARLHGPGYPPADEAIGQPAASRRDDVATPFESGNHREPRRRTVFPRAVQDVGRIHRRTDHPDEDLAVAGRWDGDVDDANPRGAGKILEHGGTHIHGKNPSRERKPSDKEREMFHQPSALRSISSSAR